MKKKEYQNHELDRLERALDLDPETRILAEVLVNTCNHVDACKGRSADEVVAGCTYIAIRETREPVSLRDLGDIVAIRMKEVCRAYQDIVEELDVRLEPESPTKYVDEFVSRLNEQFNSQLGEEVETTARELLHASWGEGFSSGSSPIGLAAGAVYLAADIEKKRVTQQEVAEVANVTPGTVRRNAQTQQARYEEVEWI